MPRLLCCWLAARIAPSPWLLTDVRGYLPNLRFHLTNDLGQPVTGASYRGKVALLYFGYTHCPDVC
ncbi:electron transport protein SCO1/SenC, partial [mine drainage metagenome]